MQNIQKILIAISILNLVTVVKRYRKNTASKYWLGLSTLIWGGLLVVGGITPNLTTTIANWFGVGRGVDFSLYLSAILLWFFVLRMIQNQQKTSEQLTDLVRAIAIRDAQIKEP